MGRDDSIDLSLKNIWKSWFTFRKGKRATVELHEFQYHLEENLFGLFQDLNNGGFRHGGYRKFIVCDNKRREISVAAVRDRLVHRLVYDYLVNIYDKTFIYDAWSCRVGKGLLGAIERTQEFLRRGQNNDFRWVWKCDVHKFFDSVDQGVLMQILSKRINDKQGFHLLEDLICNYMATLGCRIGMPIGNLTSQIFANIYLNELDRFVKHKLKLKYYLRYGDDFIVLGNNLDALQQVRNDVSNFLLDELKLQINPKSDRIMKASQGLKFLGVKIWPTGRTLNKRNCVRVRSRLVQNNVSSYSGIVKKHGSKKKIGEFNWLVLEKIMSESF